MRKIIVITGPTGVGKTKLSIALAKQYKAEIINADSMQIYKELNIGTAKISPLEMDNIPHHLLNIRSINDDYSVYEYQKEGRLLLNKDKNYIIVGGTGLYIKALLYDYIFYEEENYDLSHLSNTELDNELKKYENHNIHLNNRKQLERRLQKYLNNKEISSNKDTLLYDAIFIGLTTDRDKLYEIINNRVDKMIKKGLIEETKSLYDNNIRSKALLRSIGYKELYRYFDGYISLDESINLIKQNSRKYAKRQYTWFNNQMKLEWFKVNLDNFDETIKEVINYINNKK